MSNLSDREYSIQRLSELARHQLRGNPWIEKITIWETRLDGWWLKKNDEVKEGGVLCATISREVKPFEEGFKTKTVINESESNTIPPAPEPELPPGEGIQSRFDLDDLDLD